MLGFSSDLVPAFSVSHGKLMTLLSAAVRSKVPTAVRDDAISLVRATPPEVGRLAPQLAVSIIGQPARLRLARQNCLKNQPPRHAQHIANRRARLQAGILRHLLDPVLNPDPLLHLLHPQPVPVAQILEGYWRHEPRLQQAMRQKIGDPLGIAGVGPRARTVVHG
jgi:hypothetical protein